MADWSNLKQTITATIKANGNEEITGDTLQGILLSIVNTVGENAAFAGVAIPTTQPGTPNGPTFYLASTPGTYSNFRGLIVNSGEVCAFIYKDDAWAKQIVVTLPTDIPTAQPGPNGTSDNYIYSDGAENSKHCVLVAHETSIHQSNGKLNFTKSAWGNTGATQWTNVIPVATASADGAMSKEDKKKLDKLTPGEGQATEVITIDSLERLTLDQLAEYAGGGKSPYLQVSGYGKENIGTAQIFMQSADPLKYCIAFHTTYIPTNGAYTDKGSYSTEHNSTTLHTYYCFIYDDSLNVVSGRRRTDWVDRVNTLETIVGNKVDKVGGMGLTSNNFTDALLNQLLNASLALGKLHTEIDGNLIKWGAQHNANGFVTAGTYRIKGQRTNNADNLPIGNVGSGHTLDGILYVFDSSLTGGTGQTDDSTITQLLVLSNRVGGQEGGQWIRSGYGVNTDSLTWKPWAKMQTNMEVGVINDTMQLMDSAGNQTLNTSLGMNSLVDNGIYSGVYIPENGTSVDTKTETFVMIVINNYAVASPAGYYYTIRQIKLSVNSSGNDKPLSIMARDGSSNKQTSGTEGYSFSEWKDVIQDKRVDALSTYVDNINDAVDDLYNRFGNNASVGANTVISPNLTITATSIDTFDELWKTAGGTIDKTAKNEDGADTPYVANGLNLTYEEARLAYIHRIQYPSFPKLYRLSSSLKTVLCLNTCYGVQPNIYYGVHYCHGLEVLKVATNEYGLIIPATSNGYFVNDCNNLREIQGIMNAEQATTLSSYFIRNCPLMEEFRLRFLKVNASFETLPKLSYDTIECLVTYAKNATNISIKVHADVYAKLTGDTTNEAAAALTEEELAQWVALNASAVEKQITFATAV